MVRSNVLFVPHLIVCRSVSAVFICVCSISLCMVISLARSVIAYTLVKYIDCFVHTFNVNCLQFVIVVAFVPMLTPRQHDQIVSHEVFLLLI